jgi:RNA polymerase sigma-70 factor (ECF subfamily)
VYVAEAKANPDRDVPAPQYEIGAVYRAHAQTVARWATRLGGPAIDVEDVVQEVFLTAHRLLPEFRGEAKITTWLFRITQNQVRHQRRKLRFRQFLTGTANDVIGQTASTRPTPVEVLEQRQASATVYRVLDGMSDKYRTAFILFEIEQVSGEEIATLLGQKVATIWVWLHRARAQFAAGLAKIERAEGSMAASSATAALGPSKKIPPASA